MKVNLLLLRVLLEFSKSKIYKHKVAVSKNVCFDVLDDIAIKYNNAFHRTIKMKAIDVKPDSYAEYNVDSNDKDPKFQVSDPVRVSKYKNVFAKGYSPNWSEVVFAKCEVQFHGHIMLLMIFMEKKFLEQ